MTRKLRSNWVFNAGEDAQRQILQAPLVRTSKIDRIFLTSSDAAVSLGLPGEPFSRTRIPLKPLPLLTAGSSYRGLHGYRSLLLAAAFWEQPLLWSLW